MFYGSMVALVTPMTAAGDIHFDQMAKLIDWQIENGTQAIISVGTTGEGATLTDREKINAIRFCVERVAERIPVIAGTAHQSTQHTIELTQQAMDVGADGALIMTPAYIKPTQEGLVKHYEAIANNCALPIILYNVPSRTVCDMLPTTVARLAHCPNIVGIKEATGKVDRVSEIKMLCGDKMDVFSGDDSTCCELMLNGAKGVISITTNVAPKQMRAMCDAALAKNATLAKLLDEKLMAVHVGCCVETNPMPVKWALAQMGMIDNHLRLPLTPFSMPHQEGFRQGLMAAGVSLTH